MIFEVGVGALLSAALYVAVWRLPLRLFLRSNAGQIVAGSLAAVLLLLGFSWGLPALLLYMVRGTEAAVLSFPLADIWTLAMIGFFQGLLCLIPLPGWFDEAANQSPLRQRRHPVLLFGFAGLFAGLQAFALSGRTSFGAPGIEYLSYGSLTDRRIAYEDVAALEIDSDLRTSYGSKGGVRRYSVLQMRLVLKNGEPLLFVETEETSPLLARKAAALALELRRRGIPTALPFVLPGQEQWKAEFEKNLAKATGPLPGVSGSQ